MIFSIEYLFVKPNYGHDFSWNGLDKNFDSIENSDSDSDTSMKVCIVFRNILISSDILEGF